MNAQEMEQFDPSIPPRVSGTRPCNVLTVAESLIATVELAAAYPMRLLQEQGLCNYRYRNVIEVTPEDMLWSDLLFVVRGVSYRTLGVVRQARVLGRFVCSYWDDDAFHIPKSSLSYKAFADAGRQKTVRLILAESNLITCSTAPLSDELFRQTGRRALQLTVPAIDPVALPRPHLNNPPHIGYAGGIDHTGVLERYVVPALELLLQKGRQFSFEVIGPRPAMSDALRKRTKLQPHTGSYAQWIKVRNSLDWDLALAPLEESHFTACKYHNKFLEMASAAIPGVFSTVMPFSAAVADGVEGLLTPNTPLAWADCVEKLMDDPELRRLLAVNAWNKINRDNSPRAVVLSFVQQMKPALAHRAPGEPRVLGIVTWRLVGKPLIFLATLRALGLAGGFRRLARKILAPERVFAGLDMPRSEVLHLPKRTISGLEFRLGTHGRCLCGRVNLALCDTKTGEVLRHAQRDINDLEDNAVTAFAFEPLDAGALHKAVLKLQTDCQSPVAVYERRTSLLTRIIIKPLRMLKFAGPVAGRRIWLNFLPRQQPTETNTPR